MLGDVLGAEAVPEVELDPLAVVDAEVLESEIEAVVEELVAVLVVDPEIPLLEAVVDAVADPVADAVPEPEAEVVDDDDDAHELAGTILRETSEQSSVACRKLAVTILLAEQKTALPPKKETSVHSTLPPRSENVPEIPVVPETAKLIELPDEGAVTNSPLLVSWPFVRLQTVASPHASTSVPPEPMYKGVPAWRLRALITVTCKTNGVGTVVAPTVTLLVTVCVVVAVTYDD